MRRVQGRRLPASVVGPRLRDCGQRMVGSGGVQVVAQGDVAHFAGLATCGLVWLCSVCGPKIRQRRAVEVAQVLDAIGKAGFGREFATFTAAHHRGQSLRELLRWSEKAWAAMRESRAYRELGERFGLRMVVCARDLTWGAANGWHPHRHVVYLTRSPLSPGDRHALESALFECWQHQLGRLGMHAVREVGTMLKPITDGQGMSVYLAKVEGWSAALEVARSDLKTGRGCSHTIEELMTAGLIDGEAEAFQLVIEYAEATRGRRMMTWGQDVRHDFATMRELSDEEAAAEEVGGTTVAVLGAETWGRLAQLSDIAPLMVLEHLELGGVVALRALLEEFAPGGDWYLTADP